ncbi:type VI secretion system baseplate subunit TssF [Janthinobacterium lividum]|uniref:Type VI secretion system baseplate subunit TssF n=1 Tax=Janthinobacterium lividum TaxID=29581 RepID=A0ABU0XWZ3_9BURK|nr:type VI secretion system baseplate subunit TssF [Janthinobacterium lividum]MDQ4627948.1 type VI secretion system baseplate subunit TssF [Janthinobacterium lividum]MDQ4676766.1 type VI secretion system baseplate subunit TssF [Janthinobacterium lividum]MDQ4686762.1 type VI secretion system baseplate subunit TssF [Janthinobacterium lividum]
MEQLLPYYERELGLFRQYTREFSSRYPKAAGRLLIAGETCEDPHIERLIQSVALLTARVAKRLDDAYPQFTHSLLDTLYPHYLRPFPSCSIVRIAADEAPGGGQLDQVAHVARGTVLRSQPVQGVACKFTSTYDVTLAPLVISRLHFSPVIDAPPGLRLPAGASALLSIQFTSSSDNYHLDQPDFARLRLFADGEPSVRAALLDALFLRGAGAYVALDEHSPWQAVDGTPLAPAGYAEDDALIPISARSHPALRLLTEYFAFPEKFHFIDIGWSLLTPLLPKQCRQFTLHLPLKGVRSDSHEARLLSGVSRDNLLLGCTPVVNLFAKSGVPIRLTHTEPDYALAADATHAFAYDIHSIEAVTVVRKDETGERLSSFLPLYASLQGAQAEYGQERGQDHGQYWLARRDETVAAISPGHEMRLSLIDPQFSPSSAACATVSTQLLCSNRDLPVQLHYGLPGGDLLAEDVPDGIPARFLRKPSPSMRFLADTHWRLIAHLSLNYSSLTQAGLGEFQKMLSLYDLPRSPATQRLIQGIVTLEHGSTRAWMPTVPFPTLMPGIAIRLGIDEQAFVGSSIYIFAQVVQRYFALNSQLNCFSQLTLLSHRSGEELLRCPERSADATPA